MIIVKRFGRKFSKSENGPKIGFWGGFQMGKFLTLTLRGNQSLLKHVIWCKNVDPVKNGLQRRARNPIKIKKYKITQIDLHISPPFAVPAP